MFAANFRPKLEELDARNVPSVVTSLPLPVESPVIDPLPVLHAPTPHPLLGTGSGNYQGPSLIVDAGTSFTMNGTATLANLGTFQVTGGVQGVGMIASGRAMGELILTNAHGSITLELHGPIQPGFSSIPAELVYSITKATGTYQHLTGYGTVGIKLTPAPIPVVDPPPVGHAVPIAIILPSHGTVSLKFS